MSKKFIDLTGQKFGRLQVVKRLPNKANRSYFECQCDCGKVVPAYGYKLIQETKKSCGCLCFGQIKNINGHWKGYEEISGKFWMHISNRRSRPSKELEFSITIEYIWDLYLKQNRKCALTGIDICFPSKSYTTDGTASLDRIDSNKGYIPGNVQWVHKTVNKIKMDLNQTDFINWCKLITNYNINGDKNVV